MAQRCVGLVIGPRKLKAVELTSRFGEVSLNRYWLVDLPDYFRGMIFGQAPAPDQGVTLPPELQEILGEESEVSVSIPSELCFYREIEFPFTDLKKINQVIRLEAEGYFPFEMDEYLLDFLPPVSQDHTSQVLTFVLPRSQFSQALTSLNALGIDPAFSGIEGLTLPLLSINQPEQTRLWLEIGTERSILVGSLGTVPLLYRRLPLGLGALLSKLSRESGGDRVRAEQMIAQIDLSQPPAEGDSTGTRIISDWADSLLAKVNETLHWFERNRKEETPASKFKELVLTGNGALIKGLDVFFEQELTIPSRKFQMPDWIKQETALDQNQALILSEPLSLALARVRREGKKLVNFRKGEFAWKMEFQIPYRRMVFPAILLVLLLAMGAAKGYGQYRLNKTRNDQIKNEMIAEYQKLFPGSVPTDPVRQLTQSLTVSKSKIEVYRDLLYPTAVDTLSAIADQLPEGSYFILSRYSYTGNKVRLEGESADFAGAKGIVDLLGKVEFFQKAILEDSRANPKGKVNFAIQIELKSPGEKL